MRTVNNASETFQIVDGFTCQPGISYIPGSQGSITYIDPAGSFTTQDPARLESFGLGFLIVTPFLTVLSIRWALRLLKPASLDRFG